MQEKLEDGRFDDWPVFSELVEEVEKQEYKKAKIETKVIAE